MSIKKLNISSHLHEHTYPDFLMKHPRLIHMIYWWNGQLLQRNKIVCTELNKELLKLFTGIVMDAGSGEGMFIFPFASRYTNIKFVGIDKNMNHLGFCRKYKSHRKLQNVQFFCQSLEQKLIAAKFDLIYCVGTLQYIENDVAVIGNFHQALTANGKAIIYVPINGKTILPFYRNYLRKRNNYESEQNRKRVYSEKEITEKIQQSGFTIISKKYTYGTFGIIAHEIYSILLIKIGSSKYFIPIYYLLLLISSPFIFVLVNIDFLLNKNNGNGLLLILTK